MGRIMMAIVVLFCLVQNSHAEAIMAATAEWKPYAVRTKDGFKGIAVDILKEIARRTGDNIIIELYPAPRLKRYFETKKIDINFADSLYWNKISAPPTYIFTDSYLFVKEYVYSMTKDDLKIQKIEDLHGKTVGITRGYYYSMVEDAFNHGFIRKERADTDELLFKKLVNGRNTLIFMDELSFNFLVNRFNYDKTRFKRGLQLTYAPLGIKVRMEKKHLITRFNHAIDDMRKDASINKIIDKYDNKTEF